MSSPSPIADAVPCPDASECAGSLQTVRGGRIESVDVARLMAIFIIIYGHMSVWGTGSSVCNLLHMFLERGLCNPSAIFFIFSGYFAAKSKNWRKSVTNALWCFASLALWVVLSVLFMKWRNPMYVAGATELSNWVRWLGLHTSVFIPTEWACTPVIGTYWYVRDLAFLLLLTPVLKRVARPLLVVLLVLSLFVPELFCEDADTLMSPFAVVMFLIGCVLRSLPEERQAKCLSACSPLMVVAFWLFSLLFFVNDIVRLVEVPHAGYGSLFGACFSMLLLYQTAVLLCGKLPWLGRFATRLSPAIFLAYVTHDLFRLALEPWFAGTHVMTFAPFADLALCWGVYYLLARVSPRLLRLVAYTKVA